MLLALAWARQHRLRLRWQFFDRQRQVLRSVAARARVLRMVLRLYRRRVRRHAELLRLSARCPLCPQRRCLDAFVKLVGLLKR